MKKILLRMLPSEIGQAISDFVFSRVRCRYRAPDKEQKKQAKIEKHYYHGRIDAHRSPENYVVYIRWMLVIISIYLILHRCNKVNKSLHTIR